MLTLILLVVLGGGVGILAVSMAEAKPATNAPDSRRARVEGDGSGDPDEDPGDGPDGTDDEHDVPDEPEEVATPATVPVPAAPAHAQVAAPTPPAPIDPPPTRPEPRREPRPAARRGSGPERRLQRGDVPRSQTAIEGELGDLLRPSIPRRVTSLVGVVVIVVGVGVGIAAFLGAIVGGIAELFGNAI